MRSARSEALSLAVALSLPAAVFLSFPYSALRFVPASPPAERPASSAFVDLTPEQEARAMQRAKTSGRSDPTDAAIRPSDLILRTLPDDVPAPVVRLSDRARPPAPERIGWRPPPYLPTRAAPVPAALPAETDAPPPSGFMKEDLLKLDD